MVVLQHTTQRTVSPTVSTSAYADGDNIGGTEYQLQSVVNNDQGGFVWTITVLDYAKQTPAFTLVFFSAEPSNTTFTDNAALDIHDSDMPYYIGHVSIEAADYASFSDNAAATKTDVGIGYVALSDNLWVVLVADGAATFAAATDLVINIIFRMD